MSEFDKVQDSEPVVSRGPEIPLEIGMLDNTLLVNGHELNVDTNPETVLLALTEGRTEIMAGLEEFRRNVQKLNPGANVAISPFKVVSLGETYKEALSREAVEQASKHFQQIFTSREDLKEELAPFWDAVVASGFKPHVRAFGRNRWIDIWAEPPSEE